MGKRIALYVVLLAFVVTGMVGCASAPKKMQEEVKGLKTKVETLETKVEGVETKQAEVERVTTEQAQALEELKTAKTYKTNIGIRKSVSADVKEIQVCLKNAGFYNGTIDGIKGPQTKTAIKEFQKANGLTADGVVGNKTWDVLGKYSQ
jgi:hypothetical protein